MTRVLLVILTATSLTLAACSPSTDEPSTEDEPVATVGPSGPSATEASESGPDLSTTTEDPIPRPDLSKISAALADAGFPSIEVVVLGHEATVSGPVPDEAIRQAVLAIVADSTGITSVVDHLDLGD